MVCNVALTGGVGMNQQTVGSQGEALLALYGFPHFVRRSIVTVSEGNRQPLERLNRTRRGLLVLNHLSQSELRGQLNGCRIQ